MKDVSILRETEPRIGLGRQLLQDPASYGADVAGDGAEFGKNDSSPSNESVEDRHLPLALDRSIRRSYLIKISYKESWGFRVLKKKKKMAFENRKL